MNALQIQRAGIASSVQDSGRFGMLQMGIPPAGAMDWCALVGAAALFAALPVAKAALTVLGGVLLQYFAFRYLRKQHIRRVLTSMVGTPSGNARSLQFVVRGGAGNAQHLCVFACRLPWQSRTFYPSYKVAEGSQSAVAAVFLRL